MIGLGKWQADIDNILFKGAAVFTIADENGNYKIDLELPGEDLGVTDIDIQNIQEDGDTLTGEAKVDILPGNKPCEISLTFSGDVCNGFLKVPFIGKIKVKDANKIG
jgi:hypothetical protein